uniref:MATH domain-containing protein n=1 Tax=Cucumis sativus TaxID=3659 RepID=A0A0A0KRR8_CUCSA
MYLVTVEDEILTTTLEVNVFFTLLVYDSLEDEYLAVHDGKTKCFHAMKTEWGFENLVSLDTFNVPSNGFLVDDYCAFGVDVFIMKFDGKGEILSSINQPENYKFTWKFKDFSQLRQNRYESNAFTVENYRWKISLYPNGYSQASSEYLSLFLALDSVEELPSRFSSVH